MTTQTADTLAAAPATPTNREGWIARMAQALRADFTAAGYPLPERIRFSCGWTSQGSRSNRIGEHWSPAASGDQTHEIFISPSLADGLRVADVLTHELCHAAAPAGAGHGRPFKAIADALGLEPRGGRRGLYRATEAGDTLRARLEALIAEIGPYPHAELSDGRRPSAPPRQTARMIKAYCPTCGYTVRAARRWLDLATPVCPIHAISMVREDTGEAIRLEREIREIGDVTIPTPRRVATPAPPAEDAAPLAPAPFPTRTWILRAVEALDGPADLNDVETVIRLEAADARRDTRAAAERAQDGWIRSEARRAPVCETPTRLDLSRAWTALLDGGFLEAVEDSPTGEATITDKGRTEDPDAETAEDAPAETAEAVRSRRFARLDLATEAEAEAGDLDHAPDVEAPQVSKRFRSLDLD